jgi:hypothetical protein
MFSMPEHSYCGPLPPLTQKQEKIRDQLMTHVDYLAGKIGERHIWYYENLQAAANYIELSFKNLNYQVTEQSYIVENVSVKNLRFCQN